MNLSDYFTTKEFRRGIWLFVSLTILFFFFIPFIFSGVHELFHILVGMIHGLKLISIEIYYPNGGTTTFYLEFYFLTESEAMKWREIIIAGSIGSCSVILILNRLLYHKTKFSIYLAFNIITSYWVWSEFNHWFLGVKAFMEGNLVKNDSFRFLKITPEFNPFVLIIILILSLIMIYLWLGVSMIKKANSKINEIKEVLNFIIEKN